MTDDPGRVEIVRTIDAPRVRVFNAWTRPGRAAAVVGARPPEGG
jgi:uncharacterized protein YndB with AHSA1/START domain